MPNAGTPEEGQNKEPETQNQVANDNDNEVASAQSEEQSHGSDRPEGGRGGRGRGKRGPGGGGREGGGRGGRGGDDRRGDRQDSEWEEKIIQVRRVTKVVKGGKKLSFRAVVAVGNGKGQVGVGIGKASEVIMAIQKGIADARKSLVSVPLIKTTIPHEIVGRQGSSRVLLKPAAKGTGVIAGGATRAVLELAGIGDVMCKSLGSRSPLNVARATVNGLSELRTFEQAARLRGITVKQMLS
ncbi:MAG: 30S ribosomal protein S5 [Candidatus Obscuribacterales bacterium]|nr:30S ribosomal protein S5 [Cyanobacteria bacterium HKST-UBA01]MCB9467810.1 30S ribosomal protein S5 [Candidatus Obscuribacterales bacterium]